MNAPAPSTVLPNDLRERFQAAVQGADNPVAAVRALRRVAARLPARYQGQRDAIRWAGELALRPHWRDLRGDRAAKAAAWAALDGLWDGFPQVKRHAGDDRTAPPKVGAAAARLREALK